MEDVFKGASGLSDCNKGRIFRGWKQYNVDLDASKLLYGSDNTEGGAFRKEYLSWEKLFPLCYDVSNTTECFGLRSAIDSGSEADAQKALLARANTGASESTTTTPCEDDDAAMKSGSVGSVPTCSAAKEHCSSSQTAPGGPFKGHTMGSIAQVACACTCPGSAGAGGAGAGGAGAGGAGAGSKGDSSDGFPVVIVAVAAAVLVLLLCVLVLCLRKKAAESDKSPRQELYVNPVYVKHGVVPACADARVGSA